MRIATVVTSATVLASNKYSQTAHVQLEASTSMEQEGSLPSEIVRKEHATAFG